MKKAWINFLKNFQPSYSVTVNMYHVIPGNPVQKFKHQHDFGKGELDQAKRFYDKVISNHTQLGGFTNTEISLIKGKKTLVQLKNYGPVDMVKGMNIQSA